MPSKSRPPDLAPPPQPLITYVPGRKVMLELFAAVPRGFAG